MTLAAPDVQHERLSPVAATDRVVLLDVLRGFALYGVLLANTTVWYSGLGFLPKAERLALTTSVDDAAALALRLLVDAKAMTIFSVLFGVGFSIQLDRAAARGARGLAVFLRRLGILLAIGVAHVLLLFWGDILVTYALVGFALVLFRNQRIRTLLGAAVLFIFVPQLIFAIPSVPPAILAHVPQPANGAAFRAEVLAALRGHDHLQLATMQGLRAVYYSSTLGFFALPWTLGRFLIGYAAGKSGILRNAKEHGAFFRRLLLIGLVVGVAGSVLTVLEQRAASAAAALPVPAGVVLVIPQELTILGVAAAYVAGITLLTNRPAAARILSVLAPVGQMALTNYLLQSLVGTFIFYGWGLGFVGQVGVARCIPITMAIFAAQIVLSRLWLRRYRFGPVEWLWRSLTYGQRPPMRRT